MFFPTCSDPSTVYVLVPGAGLGRLAFELAKHGYCCQGNEWSLFMLFGSNFVLNKWVLVSTERSLLVYAYPKSSTFSISSSVTNFNTSETKWVYIIQYNLHRFKTFHLEWYKVMGPCYFRSGLEKQVCFDEKVKDFMYL